MPMSYATFDLDDLMQEFGDLDTVRELVTIVRSDLEQYATRLSAAFDANDHATVRETAHAVKGTVANVSARACRELADRLDTGLKTGNSDVVGLVPDLLVECRKLRAELGHWLEAAGEPAR